jgi:putative phosphonate transport system ATP-binding protein
MHLPPPLLQVRQLTKQYGFRIACTDVNLDLFPSEIICLVGESGSGKTTLLNMIAGRIKPDSGSVRYDLGELGSRDLWDLSEAERRLLARSEWGFVQQNARDGLRMRISAGANIAERPMMLGQRHYGKIRRLASEWLERVEIDPERIDDFPDQFSGGMQQRLQIARNLVTNPHIIFMDEPTSGLDVSVQARLLDILRSLVGNLQLSGLIVSHDLAVARLLSDRILVMKEGRIIESGLTDQVLDDPHHPYTQLLVSSILPS